MILTNPEANEYNFIFDSWARSFQKSKWAGCIRNCDYDTVSRAAMAEIIDRGARVSVAVEEMADGTRNIVGYSVSEPKKKVLHYLYVKRALRQLGVGRRLLHDIPGVGPGWVYTYKTGASDRFLRGWQWDPTPARVKG